MQIFEHGDVRPRSGAQRHTRLPTADSRCDRCQLVRDTSVTREDSWAGQPPSVQNERDDHRPRIAAAEPDRGVELAATHRKPSKFNFVSLWEREFVL